MLCVRLTKNYVAFVLRGILLQLSALRSLGAGIVDKLVPFLRVENDVDDSELTVELQEYLYALCRSR